jgi:diguanylate cyclase (GGDEF)-like protein/PAS domain S-box-containing protein
MKDVIKTKGLLHSLMEREKGVTARGGAEAGPVESLFAQLLERIMKGRGIHLGSGTQSEISLEILLENSPDPILALGADGLIEDANPAFCKVFGYSSVEILGSSILDLLPDGYRQGFADAIKKLETGGDDSAGLDDILAFRGRKRDGSLVSMDCLFATVVDNKRRRVMAVIRDLSVDKELIDQLRESKDQYVALTETVTEAIFRIDGDFNILFANSGVKNTFGYDREELIGRNLARLFPEEVFRRHEGEFRKYFYVDDQDRNDIGLEPTIELLGVTKHRGVAPMEISFGNSKDFRGRTLTCIIREISQRKTTERKLRHLAYHDTLTGLGNRDLFNDDMMSVLEAIGALGTTKAALLFMDLDGFKHINDTMGHPAGDELLVETAKRIRYCLRERDSAYRFGGDEFVVLLPYISHPRDVVLVAERLLKAIHQPCELHAGAAGGARVEVSVSIGAAILPDHGGSAEAATKSADIAMYCSKEAGTNRYTIYDETLKTRSTHNWRLEQEMRLGLVKGEFEMHYQPIVDRDGRIQGLEALVRWKRGGEPYLSPSEFIPKAEENGMIVPLGSWVLHRSLADLKRLDDLGYHELEMSVNVSCRQLELPDFVESLAEAIEGAGVDSSRIKLEITETTLLRDPDGADSRILALKQRFPKMMVVIDDFGTGYSSLSYLARMPVDSLKIDISFVRSLQSEQNRKVVNAILNLAESLDINVVAEGIEDPEQRDFFRERRCRSMQGFLFMKGLPIGEIERHLAEQLSNGS